MKPPRRTEKSVRGHVYVYQIEPYRDADGKWRSHQRTIGKKDPATGKVIYHEDYLIQLMRAGEPLPSDALFPEESVLRAEGGRQCIETARKLGSAWVFRNLGEQLHLTETLNAVFPSRDASVLFETGCYLVMNEGPFNEYEEWAAERVMVPEARVDHRRITELLDRVGTEEISAFWKLWAATLPQSEYAALDITSFSSYSELMGMVSFGHNRDEEALPQLNLCLLVGLDSDMPLYQVAYEGSMNDVSTLQTTINRLRAAVPTCPIRAVMDKGFYSRSNVCAMLSPKQRMDFVCAVPFSDSFARDLVLEVKSEGIVSEENLISGLTEPVFGVHNVCRFPGAKERVHAYLLYNRERFQEKQLEVWATARKAREALEAAPDDKDALELASRYFTIRRSSKRSSGFVFHPRPEREEQETRFTGWLVIISNRYMTPGEAIALYRRKDVVEKTFDRAKNTLGLRRLRVHTDDRAESKLFVGFIAQILVNTLDRRMKDTGLLSDYSVTKLLRRLDQLKVYMNGNNIIITPTTRWQRETLKKLGIPLPKGLPSDVF